MTSATVQTTVEYICNNRNGQCNHCNAKIRRLYNCGSKVNPHYRPPG